jgi:hypothetical protein
MVRWGLLFLTTPFMVLGLCLPVVGLRSVVVDGSRTTGVLRITREWMGVPVGRETLPLATIRGSRLVEGHGRRAAFYRVVLDTDRGARDLSTVASGEDRINQREALETFLKDPDAPAFRLVYDPPAYETALFLFFLFLPLAALQFLWQGVSIRLEAWRDTVTVERTRWPLRPVIQSLPRHEVVRAQVEVQPNRSSRQDPMYRILLVLASGQEVPLFKGWVAARRTLESAAREINAALGQPSSTGGWSTHP